MRRAAVVDVVVEGVIVELELVPRDGARNRRGPITTHVYATFLTFRSVPAFAHGVPRITGFLSRAEAVVLATPLSRNITPKKNGTKCERNRCADMLASVVKTKVEHQLAEY